MVQSMASQTVWHNLATEQQQQFSIVYVYTPHLYSFIYWWSPEWLPYLWFLWITLQWIWDCRYLFSILFSFPLDICPNCVWSNLRSHQHFVRVLFSTSSTTFTICCPFFNNHSDRCEVIFHCGFDLHSPDNQWCWASLPVPVLWKSICLGLLPIFLICLFVFLILSCRCCLYIYIYIYIYIFKRFIY